MVESLANMDMVKVIAQGTTVECDRGAHLRQVLLKHDIELYNGGAKVINCHGIYASY